MKPSLDAYPMPKFQFHKGTIKTHVHKVKLVNLVNFNSIKVRLELLVPWNSVGFPVFQFHKGTIRTNVW